MSRGVFKSERIRLKYENEALTQQRDELLEVCRAIVDAVEEKPGCFITEFNYVVNKTPEGLKLKQAIAKAEGGEDE